MADTIKGICILFILITHFTWSDGERLQFLFPFYIDLAVPMFMFISGYVNCTSFDQQQNTDLYSSHRMIKSAIRFTIPFTIVFIIEVCMCFVANKKYDLLDFLLIYMGGV